MISSLALLASPGLAQERELEDTPAPASTEEVRAPLERAHPEPELKASRFGWVRRQKRKLPPFFADTQLYLRYRTAYYRQDRPDKSTSEAWAMGGSLYYRSGWWRDRLAFELEGFTSQPIIAPDRRDGTLLLDRGQDGYGVLGVGNAQLRHGDFVLTGYRQKLDLPYLNKQDNRMTPNTFEAVKLAKDRGALRFAAGYAWRFKRRNGDDFVTLSQEVGVSQDRGVAFGDLVWRPNERLHLGASFNVTPDLLSVVYLESGWKLLLRNEIGVRVDGQFTTQNTIGDELLPGGSFDTWSVGLRGSASWKGALLRLGFSATGDERGIFSPYGSSPSFISLMQRTFTQEDEKALLVSLSYDFSRLGASGLSAIATFAQGWDGVVGGRRGDAREVNVTLDYHVGRGWLEGFWLRGRAAWLDVDGEPRNGTDYRVMLRYELPLI